MSKSSIYATNLNAQTIAIGGNVTFTNIVRRYGPNVNLSGGNVTISGCGYYDVDVMLSIEGTATGSATFQVTYNGTNVNGAYTTVATTDGSLSNIVIPLELRAYGCVPTTVTIVVSGVSVIVNNASIRVTKN